MLLSGIDIGTSSVKVAVIDGHIKGYYNCSVSRKRKPDYFYTARLGRIKPWNHNWVIANTGKELQHTASLYHQASGCIMNVFTIAPGIQFYTINEMDGSLRGKNNQRQDGVCILYLCDWNVHNQHDGQAQGNKKQWVGSGPQYV